jgi:hypothetical protein
MAVAARRPSRYDAGMRQALKLHPDSRCDALTRIEVEIARLRSSNLQLRYFLFGKIGDLQVPPETQSARTDELWRHTCLEAFVRLKGAAYCEFNFAPSTQWAAYRFSNYREEMSAAEIGTPRIAVKTSADCYELQAALELAGLLGDATWHVGLSAVIEEANGRKSYWALAHPPGKPDFHHADGFALNLASAELS